VTDHEQCLVKHGDAAMVDGCGIVVGRSWPRFLGDAIIRRTGERECRRHGIVVPSFDRDERVQIGGDDRVADCRWHVALAKRANVQHSTSQQQRLDSDEFNRMSNR